MRYLIAGCHPWSRGAVVGGRGEFWEFVDTPKALRGGLYKQPRYAFFLHWNWIVSDWALALCECVNFHCTPLPYGRGGHPIENMLLHCAKCRHVKASHMHDEYSAIHGDFQVNGRCWGGCECLGFEEVKSTVITAHRMTSELDAGPIYGTRGPIALAGTKEQILERFIEPCADLIRWIVETNPQPTPQVGEPTYFKRLSPEAYTQFWASRNG